MASLQQVIKLHGMPFCAIILLFKMQEKKRNNWNHEMDKDYS